MRKVVLYELISIDGVAEEPSNFVFDGDDEFIANLARVIEKQDAVLLGRGTYDYWVDYWPTAEYEPFASFINGTVKHVFTSNAPSKQWSASVMVDSPAVEYVADLKQQSGADIGIHGSISLAQSLIRAELVDELRLVVMPALAGTGRRLFEDGASLQRFELLEADRTRTGSVLLSYGKRSA